MARKPTKAIRPVYVPFLPFAENTCNLRSYRIASISEDPVCVDVDFQEYIRYVGGFEFGDWVRTVEAGAARPGVADGVYRAEIVTESVSPVSFLLN